MNNIDAFDEAVADFFSKLYHAFPVRINLTTISPRLNGFGSTRFSMPEYSSGENWPEYEMKRKVAEDNLKAAIEELDKLESITKIRTETARWLLDTGFIKSDEIEENTKKTSIRFLDKNGQEHLDFPDHHTSLAHYIVVKRACLTAKGLEALRAVPKSISSESPKKSLGEQLTEYTKETITEVRKEGISQIVGQVIGHAVKAMSS